MCVCVVIPFILDVRLVDVPAEVAQEEGHTGFLHLPSAVLALIFSREGHSRFFTSSTVKSSFVYKRINRSSLVGHFFFNIYRYIFFVRKFPVCVTAKRLELTSQRQKVSTLPTEPPGRPVVAASVFMSSRYIRGTHHCQLRVRKPTDLIYY